MSDAQSQPPVRPSRRSRREPSPAPNSEPNSPAQTAPTAPAGEPFAPASKLPDPAPRRAPKEPPSTLKYHLIGVASGLFLTPLALLLLVLGCSSIMAAPTSGSATFSILIGIAELLAGAALIALAAAVTGYFSSLALGVGALWPLALVLTASPLRGAVAAHENTAASAGQNSFFWSILADISLLSSSGLFPVMAIMMMAAALAAQRAYQAGQAQAVEEHRIATTSDRELAEPSTPAARLRDHLIASALALVATLAGLLCMIPLHDQLAVVTGAAGTVSNLPTVLRFGLPVVGIALLFVAIATGARSATGVPLAGVIICIIPGLTLAIVAASGGTLATDVVDWLSDHLTASMHVSGGPLMAMGLVMVACGLTALWCRQAGHRDQIRDFAQSA